MKENRKFLPVSDLVYSYTPISLQKDLADEEAQEKAASERNRLVAIMSHTEREYNMEMYDSMDSVVQDYCDLVMQLGYVTLFAAAFPLAPLLALISNYVEIRIDAYKLLYVYRRPVPANAASIEYWGPVIQCLCIFSVLTNTGLICFTLGSGDDDSDMTGSFAAFFASQYSLFAVLGAVWYFIPATPASVPIQLKRQKYLVDKVIVGMPDKPFEVYTRSANHVYTTDIEDAED